ncbi:glycosyltransferase family 1 protein [Bacillus sp. UNC438CL73TsuS30]|uniref:glycosyltransferase family 1 protein n=1 Tax=Bacillus sp. UNC438CL73TsuS30 TaxID=1340434 RepID=UPI00054E909E|nr:glycosyltransferase family 1 protein [Bacillus sp. UNC438CL73TsuS30]
MVIEYKNRVLHVVSEMHRGGAETMLMNIYRNIDRSKVQFDFISHNKEKSAYDDEILSLGGRIFYLPSLGSSGPISYIKNLRKIIKEKGPYVAVHAHTDYQTGFVALASRLAGVKKRICHSHNTAWKANPNLIDKVFLSFYKTLILTNTTDFCACGKEAAKFLFRDWKKDNHVNIIQNGIDLDVFINQNGAEKDEIYKSLNIDRGTLIIGHIGRFVEQKNHEFIIKIALTLKEKSGNFKFLLIGEGPLLPMIKEKIIELGLSDYVLFLGVRSDIPNLMSIFDVFLMPSHFEGLPVSMIEAQAVGIPCVVSDVITDEVDMGIGLIKKYSLKSSLDEWVSGIQYAALIERPSTELRYNSLTNRGYNVKENINVILSLYGI